MKKGKICKCERFDRRQNQAMREGILSDGGIETLREILELNPDGEYLFENESGKRIRGNTCTRRFAALLRKVDRHPGTINGGGQNRWYNINRY